MSKIAEIYDTLFTFEIFSKKEAYPIHKRIEFVEDNCTDIADWILKKELCPAGSSVLDVGCGTGNTLFKLAKFKQAVGLGISISEKEIEFANSQLKKLNLTSSIKFHNQSFDEPINHEKFDIIIAIESLKHSSNYSKTLKNLLKASHQDTVFIIADDFIIHPSAESKQQMVLWNAPSLFSVPIFKELMEQEGLNIINFYFFTDKVNIKSKFVLIILIFLFKFLRKIVTKSVKTLVETYLGALMLERLYQKKQMDYCIIVAGRNDIDFYN